MVTWHEQQISDTLKKQVNYYIKTLKLCFQATLFLFPRTMPQWKERKTTTQTTNKPQNPIVERVIFPKEKLL